MDHGTLALLIPLAPFMIAGLAIWTRHSRRMAEIQANATAEKAAQYAVQNQALEDRVRVLERIVTDGGYDVALQIEALRDVNRIEGSQHDGAARAPVSGKLQ
ncbi:MULTISPECIES: hypothetical protein [Novosphingobium]|nr:MULTISPECIES: hypothetical protein [Novosphingobium]KPF56660.1 hypothetical protein IP65_02520 [Novosphingobium sp. AAP1]MBB3476359.1 hypothetical protein [Novosphingobium sp. BK369]MBB3619410.1 hypothetical protein [Novosphingobium sp. BK592]NOX03987.1 hypothetical protein [Novosphingobium sp. SG754]PTR12335.1 hypothetical protein C8K11_103259 [Novosphingobium sp. GV055]